MNMKMIRTLIAAVAISLPALCQAQDWAGFNRYAEQNAQVTTTPKVVFMGDSITEGWAKEDPAFFTDNNFLGRGISGQTTSQMLVRFRKDVIDFSPRYVVILAGTNDVAKNNGDISLDNVLGNIISMCVLVQAKLSAKCHLWLCTYTTVDLMLVCLLVDVGYLYRLLDLQL